MNLHSLGNLPATDDMDLAIVLPLRNREALSKLLYSLYDPTSQNFHHYLTSKQFTDQFGPTELDYENIVRFVEARGLTASGKHNSRLVLDIHGKVADVQSTFHVTLKTYQHPSEPRIFYAPDVNPTVDAGLSIVRIYGLTDYSLLRPASHLKPIVMDHVSSGSAPNGFSYIGKDFRNAYAPGVLARGQGQSIGLFEADGYYPVDISNYESAAGLTNIPLQNILLNGITSNFAGTNNGEVALDIEMAISMAPGLDSVVVFECTNQASFWIDTLDAMATNTQIRQFSSSWGYEEENSYTNSSFDAEFMKMAAQGQTFFQASGDGDAWTQPIWIPAASPYLTCVGGTTLFMNETGGSYASETVWNSGYYKNAGIKTPWKDNGGGFWGSGGGTSTNYSIPLWQQGVSMSQNGGQPTYRNIPDVALAADDIWVNYNNGTNGNFLGTSCAAPLWAGFAALVNQQLEMTDPSNAVGFLNSALYSLGRSPLKNYGAPYHDIINGNNTSSNSPNKYYATAGYDLCTGWGTPNGSNLINSLVSVYSGTSLLSSAGTESYSNGIFTLNWSAVPGWTYVAQYTTNLAGSNWNNFIGPIIATNLSMSVSDPVTNAQRFYRIILMP